VVLAIKPQNLAEVMTELGGQLKSTQLVLSIIAGARIGTLSKGLKHNCIARVMPNTPAQIGEGMSVWTATPEVTEQQKGLVGAILGAMGMELYVDDEKYIDMATAVSGSGPAYFPGTWLGSWCCRPCWAQVASFRSRAKSRLSCEERLPPPVAPRLRLSSSLKRRGLPTWLSGRSRLPMIKPGG